jgi:hypothetical protein
MSKEVNPEKTLRLLIEAQKQLERGMQTLLELVATPMSMEQQRLLTQLGVSLADTMGRSCLLEKSLREEMTQESTPQMNTNFSAPKVPGKDFVPAKDSVTWWNTTEGRFTSSNPLQKNAPPATPTKTELTGPAPIIEYPEDTK